MHKPLKEPLGVIYDFKLFRVIYDNITIFQAFRADNNLLHYKNNDLNLLINRLASYDCKLRGYEYNI